MKQQRKERRLGEGVAWSILIVTAGAQLSVLFVATQLIHDQQQSKQLLQRVGPFWIPIGGLLAAAIAHSVLPERAREAFWATGKICIGISVALFGVTCGFFPISH